MTETIHTDGITPGREVDIRVLEAVGLQGTNKIILYFEEALARSSWYEQDLKTYQDIAEHERPFIELGSFLRFQREMSPYFDAALTTVPLMVTIISTSESHDDRQVIKGLLPFLDEMDLS